MRSTTGVPADLANPFGAAGEARLHGSLRNFWHPVAFASQVTDRPVRATLLEEQLVLVRLGGAVRCFPDLCVHRGTALSLGEVDDDQLRCAYHGWTYDADGRCTRIPARFGTNVPRRARLHRYPCLERQGLVYVCLADEPRFAPPEFPAFDDPDYRIVEVSPYDWNTSMARRLENFVDFAHFAWVHDGVLGDRDRPEVPDHDVERVGHELRFEYPDYVEPVSDAKREGLPDDADAFTTDIHYRLTMPGTVLLEQENGGTGNHYVILFSVCPLTAGTSRSFTMLARDYRQDDLETDREVVAFNQLVIDQDRPIVESQRPEQLLYDLSAELHIRGVDRIALEYRRWLVELADELVTPS